MNKSNAVFGLGWVILATPLLYAEGPSQPKVDPKVVTVDLKRRDLFGYTGLAVIDAVNVGEDNSILLRLKNDTGATIPFGESSTTCGCVQVASQCTQLLDGSACDLQVQLKPDRNYKEQIWQQTISFASKSVVNGGSVTVNLTIQATLNGVFAAEPSRLLFIASDGVSTTAAPKRLEKQVVINVTPPVQLKNLQVEGSPQIDLFDIAINPDKKSKGQGILSVGIDAALVPEEGLHESIILKDAAGGQTRTIMLSAIRRSPIRAVPATMIVQQSEKDDSWVAFGMMINQSESLDGSQESIPPVIDVSVGGKKVPIKLLAGGPRIQRFRLDFTPILVKEIFAAAPEVTCVFDVNWGSEGGSCKNDLSFR